jgi:glycosyltransferase involved in cell wall biosynthesis
MDLRKNTSFLLTVMEKLRRQGFPHHLAILGLPPFEVSRGGFAREAVRSGISEEVHFLSGVSDADLAALYQGAAAFLYPSRGEGFGLPILESFASGTPVIASDATSIPEVAGDAALLLPSWDRRSWVEGVTRMLEDKVLRKRSIAKGLTRVKKYSWQGTAEKTLLVYKGVLQ